MFEVGVYEAKTSLPSILRRVEKGEDCVITRRGKPVAKINHMVTDETKKIKDFWKGLKKLRQKYEGKPMPSWKELYDLRHEGHQW